MRKIVGAILLGLVLCVASANGAIVFQDDFESGSGQWTLSGDAVVAGGVMYVQQTTVAEPWIAAAGTNQAWSDTGVYTLTFDTNGNTYPHAGWQDFAHTYVSMPGGLQVSFSYWNNLGAVVYKGAVLSDAAAVNANDINWRTITMIADYDALTAEVLVNTGSGNVSVWSGTLPSAPDFGTWGGISLIGQLTTNFNAYDNMTLDYVPEPATMTLMGFGGVFVLLRRRK